jgi:hypothetical protein
MKLRRGVALLRYGFVTLLADCAMFIVCCGLFVILVPLVFILAAQLFRLGTVGDWRPVPLSELLDTIMAGLTGGAAGHGIVEFILALPATLVLFMAALILYAIGRLLRRAKAYEYKTIHGVRQKTLIEDIERAFRTSQRMTKK